MYRYRYPSADVALGHTLKDHIYACHELEVYPDDRLTCGSGGSAIVFDMAKAFDDQGHKDSSDDRPRGTPLPCQVRGSSSGRPYHTGAMVVDCVNGVRSSGSRCRSTSPAGSRSGRPR